MDSRQVKTPKYMVYCVLVACIGSFSNGWTIGCANLPGDVTHQCPTGMRRLATPALPDCIPMGTSLWGFAVASFCVGGLVGGVGGGWVQTKLGRKKAIIWNTLGWIIGGLLLGLSVNVAMFIIGRILCGISCGLGSLAIPTYIGETSSIRARGAMGAMNQFLIVIGILLSAIIGLPTSSVPYWRINFAIVGVPAIVQAMLMTTCVESPRWLVSDSRLEEARAALQRLRGNNAIIQNEFYEIVEGQVGTMRARSVLQHPENAEKILSGKWSIEDINEANHGNHTVPTDTLDVNEQQKIHPDVPRTSVDNDTMINPVPTGETVPVETGDPSGGVHKPMNIFQIFRDPVIRRISLVVFMHHAIQQLSGMNAVMYYSTNIFASAFDLTMSKYMAIATNGVNFVVTIFAVYLVDRMGRRPLLLIAEGGACLFSVLLVVGYACNIPALLVVSVFMYVASFAIGIGPIPWMITSELTPTYANSSVGAVATGVNWAMNFVVGQVFPVIFAGIEGYSFAIFAGICLLAWLFTFFMLPETKNRSIENIVKGFQTGHTRMLGLARRRSSENTMVEHQQQQQVDA